MNAGIVEYVRALPVMKIFGQSAENFEKYGHTVKRFYGFVQQWIKSSTPAFAVFMSFTSNALLPVLALGLYLYFQNGISLATLLLFLILGTGYIKPLFAINNMGIQLSIINRGVEQIDALLDQDVLEEKSERQRPDNYEILFKDVSFAYQSDQLVLDEINFSVAEGSITALVGPSGAGKSTVIDFIENFITSSGYDVVKTREPGGTAIGEQIREILLNKKPLGIL